MPNPQPNETQKEYIPRCISYMMKKEGKPQKQAIAMCYSFWERRHATKLVESISAYLIKSFKQILIDNNLVDKHKVDKLIKAFAALDVDIISLDYNDDKSITLSAKYFPNTDHVKFNKELKQLFTTYFTDWQIVSGSSSRYELSIPTNWRLVKK